LTARLREPGARALAHGIDDRTQGAARGLAGCEKSKPTRTDGEQERGRRRLRRTTALNPSPRKNNTARVAVLFNKSRTQRRHKENAHRRLGFGTRQKEGNPNARQAKRRRRDAFGRKRENQQEDRRRVFVGKNQTRVTAHFGTSYSENRNPSARSNSPEEARCGR
jgi:hypothetical protein